jgi:hypothetical protein
VALLASLVLASGCESYERIRYERPWIDNVLVGLALLLAMVPSYVVGKAAFNYAARRSLPGLVAQRYQLVGALTTYFVFVLVILYLYVRGV